MPGDPAKVTWFVTSPDAAATPPVAWAFALCPPEPSGALDCGGGAPFATYACTADPPALDMATPAADALGAATSLLLFGRLCVDSTPVFDPQSGLPTCAGGGHGVTVAAQLPLAVGSVVNHNPVADRGITFDGQPWPAPAAGVDPCVAGPRVTAGTKDHVVAFTTAGDDREAYTQLYGDPPVPTPAREALQYSQFATAGKWKSNFSFVESSDPSDAPVTEAKWTAPDGKDVAGDTPVAFTFVLRDGRGGTDWTTRTACVGP